MLDRTARDALRPFSTLIDTNTGSMDWYDSKSECRLSEVAHRYSDLEACAAILDRGDRLVYEVHTVRGPELPGELSFDSVVIFPGIVGSECHMTRGHYHASRDGELYMGMEGEGYVLMQNRLGESAVMRILPGAVVYTPAGWGHRTVNTGDVPLRFFGAYPRNLSHDYATAERSGFTKMVLKVDGQVRIVDNPRFVIPARASVEAGSL